MSKARIKIPDVLVDVFLGEARYRGAYGGRGSAKSRTFGLMAAIHGYRMAQKGKTGLILCGREFMNSLEDSSMEEVRQAIYSVPWLAAGYEVGKNYIRTKDQRVGFAFTGLRHNLDSIKSKSRILLAWVDEAEAVSEMAWRKLIPTVREAGSEIWITWNPETDGSPTDLRFKKTQPTRAKIVQVNYSDNPWFPAELEEERLNDRERVDDATYAHIWEGAYLQNSDAQIFGKKYRVSEFEAGKDWAGPYQGIDWGFSQDPTHALRAWIHDGRVWVDHEAVKVGLELDQTAGYITRRIDGFERYVTRADSARPESISYVRRHGLSRVVPCQKGAGSVEDGIAHLKSYKEIVIHPRCEHLIREFRLYSYKVDRLSGDVLPDIVDAYNHGIDALRYALEPVMRNRKAPKTVVGRY